VLLRKNTKQLSRPIIMFRAENRTDDISNMKQVCRAVRFSGRLNRQVLPILGTLSCNVGDSGDAILVN
jgi:hypothetical protein